MKRLMQKLTLLLLLSMAVKISFAQYIPVDQGSSLKFTIKNLGFGVDGSFSGFEGTINFDPQNLINSKFDVSVKAATVNTDNSLRDGHLRGEGFFDVKTYPLIRLVSKKITSKGAAFLFTGQLSIKGKSQPISFPFSATSTADGYVFKGSFKMNRKDFDVGGTSTVSDELAVNINVAAKKP